MTDLNLIAYTGWNVFTAYTNGILSGCILSSFVYFIIKSRREGKGSEK
jgi:hypothetical protein